MWRVVMCLSTSCMCLTLALEGCSIVGEDGVTYKEVVLVKDLNDPRKMVVDWDTNILFFNYCYKEQRVSAILDIEKKEQKNLDQFLGVWCSHTVHQHHGGVYVGCIDQHGRGGIYHLDSSRGQFELTGLADENIEFVHFSEDKLYYSVVPLWHVYTWSQKGSRAVPQVAQTEVRSMVVDKAGDWVIRNNAALCRLKAETGQVRCTKNKDVMLSVGPRGVAYACDTVQGGIYSVEEDATLRKVVDAPKCRGLAIDANDNFIYSDQSRVIQLKQCK